jgi:hypothetical protein
MAASTVTQMISGIRIVAGKVKRRNVNDSDDGVQV